MRAIRESMVNAAHVHSQSQSHQCVVGFLGRNKISDGRGSGVIESQVGRWREEWGWWRRERSDRGVVHRNFHSLDEEQKNKRSV
ncbi:hypothetical protein EVAR_44925_1 [Eumeta japonica]|uniref:Uncharacterized protein n=1 Tax=Eumeta variegata TaxID=151549 RepID=A0A4C1XL02_EUMVA|nr:hypothetical protein EVAR_44925_1 [Eumeta japonica]